MRAALLLTAQAVASAHAQPPPPTKLLIVGASGGTGLRAVRGLLDVLPPSQLRLVTRSPSKPALQTLHKRGVEICVADLDVPETLLDISASCTGCYIHSTAGDTKQLDTKEAARARALARALQATGSVNQVVFNSAAAAPSHGVKRIGQKHEVESILSNEFKLPSTHLRANLFMEELWKSYTRPSILKGKFPFSIPADRPLYLTSVRDMGRLAASCLMKTPPPKTGRKLNVASDVLNPMQMADAFAAAQGTPCVHAQARVMRWVSRFLLPDLYEVIQFYRTSAEVSDIEMLEKEFPGLLTPFAEFLAETGWGDPTATYEDLSVLL